MNDTVRTDGSQVRGSWGTSSMMVPDVEWYLALCCTSFIMVSESNEYQILTSTIM